MNKARNRNAGRIQKKTNRFLSRNVFFRISLEMVSTVPSTPFIMSSSSYRRCLRREASYNQYIDYFFTGPTSSATNASNWVMAEATSLPGRKKLWIVSFSGEVTAGGRS